jgi:uncharacterized repeat protein (TIGR04138 family)
MPQSHRSLAKLLCDDPRYRVDAYYFVLEALAFAQEELGLGAPSEEELEQGGFEPHLTGQQLCEASRIYALEQFGYMAKVVLNSWGIHSTSDLGEIVYNLIQIGKMKKSDRDRREDFDDVFDFDEALQQEFKITLPE